jgi:hypothetical protein
MSLEDEVKEVLEQNKTRPLDAYEQARKLLIGACQSGARCDPLGAEDQSKEGRQAFHAAHDWFKHHGYHPASEKLLIEWWNLLGKRQYESKKRIYRADTAFLLSNLYESMSDKGMALRWAMLMQADDILGEHSEGGGAGRQTLTTKYGLSTFGLDELNRIASECLSEVKQNMDWSKPAAFVEEVLCRFAQSSAGYALAEITSVREFPISKGYLSSMMDWVNSAQGSDEKGRALESLALYLLLLLPGCIPHKNVLAELSIFETDVLVQNLSPTPTVVTELLGRHFLIECKNRQVKTNVSDIGYFLYRMKLTHTKFGIIFSREGITGEDKGEAGRELIRRAFHEDDSICVVISDSDLDELISGTAQNFWWMLLGKIEALRFGRPKPAS